HVRGHRPRGRLPAVVLLAQGRGPDLEVRVRPREEAAEKTPDLGDEVQRHLDHDAVLGRARGGDGEVLPRREVGQVPHRHPDRALRAAPGLVRRGRRLQPLRRHPLGPRPCLHGDDRHRTLRQHQPRAAVSVALRAGARLAARHLRQGHRESDRSDLGGSEDARSPRASAGGPGPRSRDRAGAVGAAALVVGIVVIVVMVRMPTPKSKTAQTQAATRTPAAVKPQATWKPQAAVKPQAEVRPQAAVKPQTASKPQPAEHAISAAERKTSEELWAEQKKLDADSARVMAATPDGRRRVSEMIAKQFNVPEKLVNDLRGRKINYGEITAALAFSQQLMKRDKVTRQQALDKVLGARKAGQGWAALARSFDLRVADVLSDVRKTDKQVAKLVTLKASAR